MQQTIERPVTPPVEQDSERFHTGRVMTISGGHAVHDTYSAFLPVLLPKFIENLALSKTEAGLLTVFTQAPSLSQPFIGHLADRVSLRWLVILAPAITATTMSLLGIASSYAIIAVFLTIAGFSSAGFHAVGPVTIGHQSGSKLGRGMSVWMVGGELGRTLGPLVIVGAIGLLSLQGLPWLMGFGWLTSGLLYWRLRDIPEHFAQADPAAVQIPWQQVVREMMPVLAPLLGVIVTRIFLTAALTTYLPTFLTEEGMAFALAGISLTVLEAAGVVGAMAGGSVSDRFGRRPVIATAMGATSLLMFAFLATSGATRFALLLPLGLASLSITPVIMALVQESFPENRAFANGLYMMLNFVSRSGAVLVLGLLSDALGMNAAFTISAVISLLGLPFIYWLPAQQGAAH